MSSTARTASSVDWVRRGHIISSYGTLSKVFIGPRLQTDLEKIPSKEISMYLCWQPFFGLDLVVLPATPRNLFVTL